MPDKFDPYREALVVETKTVWPDEVANLVSDADERERISGRLHADPARAAQMEYIRLYTGFCRQITVSATDVKRD
jgi:hypothetical protein